MLCYETELVFFLTKKLNATVRKKKKRLKNRKADVWTRCPVYRTVSWSYFSENGPFSEIALTFRPRPKKRGQYAGWIAIAKTSHSPSEIGAHDMTNGLFTTSRPCSFFSSCHASEPAPLAETSPQTNQPIVPIALFCNYRKFHVWPSPSR